LADPNASTTARLAVFGHQYREAAGRTAQKP
jgi:hypothetical protein